MVTRAFYRVGQDNWPPPEDPETGEPRVVPDAVVLLITTRYAYLHAARYPNLMLEVDLEADLLGHTWAELWGQLSATTRKAIFRAEVDRQEKNDDGEAVTVRHHVPMKKIRTKDVVVRENLIPHAWGAGESVEEQRRLDKILES